MNEEKPARKVCKKCGKDKPIADFPSRFYKDKQNLYISGHCAECELERCRLKSRKRTKVQRQAERRRINENKGRQYRTIDEVQAEALERQEARHAKRDATEAWNRWVYQTAPDWWLNAFYASKGTPWSDHRLSVADRYRIRYQRDPEFKTNERVRSQAYKHDNPERVSQWSGGQSRVMDQHDGTMEKGSAMALLKEFDECPYCGEDLIASNSTLDHMDPIASGGIHGVSNLVVACDQCNRSKGSTPFMDWVETLSQPYRDNALMTYWQKQLLAPGKIARDLERCKINGFRVSA
ncbi:HNH nuclease [Magnetococcus marinus MC-1]|uniref:HNH nuclease n=1 Tax=Magnetococcus marinus (strain ATCC BAA-1437 / JCM 17883 / MC-1) TaxID=156889 RepID=A0LBA5_MAGMM|nr:HNH endonuclease signature motif containing protein [Magnetococcus marinus]ABK45248.1 HNH nuclease [Magnetococcus marinus MC-1]